MTGSGSSDSALGSVEAKVRADVGAMITAHPMGEALAELAYTLARTLDGDAGMATAAVSRELRAALAELTAMVPEGDDDLDAQFSTPIVPAEVRDPEDS